MSNRKTPMWVWVIAGTAVVLFFLCGGILLAITPTPHTNTVTTEASTPIQVVQPAPVKTTPPKAIVVKGSNSAVKSVNAKLSGTYRVDYTSSSVCIEVEFLKSNGTDGAGMMQSVNDCTADMSNGVKGSTMVNLTQMSMIKVSNTHGSWTVRFTPVE